MRKISVLVVFLVLLSIFAKVALAATASPLRVAILPVYVKAHAMDADVLAVFENALAAKFRTALAGIVPVYTIIPPSEVAPALPAVPAAGKGKIKLDKASLVSTAEKLNADIVIVAEVNNFSTSVYINGEGDYIRSLGIALRLLSYHRPSREFIDNKDHFNYLGAEHLFVEPAYVAKQLIDNLLGKVPSYR